MSFAIPIMRIIRLLLAIGCATAQKVDYAQYVDPFIGSEGAIPGYACKFPRNHLIFIANTRQLAAEMSSWAAQCPLAWSSSV
jgi:hypothetical protein